MVFHLYDDKGDVVSLYGRNIDDNFHIKHLYLPGERSGLVNRQGGIIAVKRKRNHVLCCESAGKMKTEDYTVKGPVAVMLTKTAADLDQGNSLEICFFIHRRISCHDRSHP